MREREKKGAIEMDTLLILLIGLAVVVLVVLILLGVWNPFTKAITTITPKDIDVLSAACQGYIAASARQSYCDFKEVEKNNYANCEDSRVQASLKVAGVDTSSFTGKCPIEKFYCISQKWNNGVQIVNDIKCITYKDQTLNLCTSDENKGVWKDRDITTKECPAGMSSVQGTFDDQNLYPTQICCTTKS